METRQRDLVVIGGGPAGLAAALAAREAGRPRVTIVERDRELGGILQQCIHDGFGNFLFRDRLTGPEYASRFAGRVPGAAIEVMLDAMALEVKPGPVHEVLVSSAATGPLTLQAPAVILAMGCRERTRAQLLIPGHRPAGVFTAGTVQRYVNIEGLLPGKKAVILGSGDIGLIMARRLTLEGVEVEGVFEIMPHPGGLTRNIVQCLEDYDIPLHLSTTVTFIHGTKRVEGVTVAGVDADRRPIPGTERHVACDTVVISAGLIPENELSRGAGVALDPVTRGPVVDDRLETSVPGLFACGNVVHVHDLVDYVSMGGTIAGRGAAEYLAERAAGGAGERAEAGGRRPVRPGENVTCVVPQRIDLRRASGRLQDRPVQLFLRVRHPGLSADVTITGETPTGDVPLAHRRERAVRPPEMVAIKVRPDALNPTITAVRADVRAKGATAMRVEGGAKDVGRRLVCILCPAGCDLRVSGDLTVTGGGLEVTGGRCPKGREYAHKELTAPTRTLTTTVRVEGARPDRLPVRTLGEIPKAAMRRAVRALDAVVVRASVRQGQVVVDDLLGFGVPVVAARDLPSPPPGGPAGTGIALQRPGAQ